MAALTINTKVSKWGNSLAIRIPKKIAGQFHMTTGAEVTLCLEKKQRIVITPAINIKKYTLGELLKDVSQDNIQEEIDTGSPVGEEII